MAQEYRVIPVEMGSAQALQDAIQAAADEGFEWIHAFDDDRRHLIVMAREKRPRDSPRWSAHS
jgi:hypothetical protein